MRGGSTWLLILFPLRSSSVSELKHVKTSAYANGGVHVARCVRLSAHFHGLVGVIGWLVGYHATQIFRAKAVRREVERCYARRLQLRDGIGCKG